MNTRTKCHGWYLLVVKKLGELGKFGSVPFFGNILAETKIRLTFSPE